MPPADEYPSFVSQDTYTERVVTPRRFCHDCRTECCEHCGACLKPGCFLFEECPPWPH
jgi:hypothetical protein